MRMDKYKHLQPVRYTPGTAASAVVCKVFDLLNAGFGGHLLK